MSLNRDYESFLSSFNSQKFRTLRESQKYILGKYAATYNEMPNVAIELPTGAGKSLVSLLIAEAWRQEDGKVAILTANKTLARQMQNEAQILGIPSVLMEGRGIDIPSKDKRAYHRASKIAIMNYWVYYNQNPVLDPADLLIMDDAHLAEHCLHSLYSAEIDKFAHESLFRSLVTELQANFPEYSVLHDALDNNAPQIAPPELMSFIDQVSFSNRFKEIVDSSSIVENDIDFRFRWERVRGSINEANIYLGLNSIWIKPYIYPLGANNQWSQTKQRLYMSATIGDSSDLCRRLGITNIVKIPVPKQFSERTSGRRLIVMNRIEDADLPSRLQSAILEAIALHPKSVWMCASKRDAIKYQEVITQWLPANGFFGHPSWILTNLGDEIERFKEEESGHLFVASRFDGMDFKAQECRLVIIATLPRAINLQEEFFCAYLRDSGFMSKRLNQRIVQALGRCNRDEDDYGIYVLADRRFATHFGRESNRKGIPKNIIAEIDCAEDATEDPEELLKSNVKEFMNGNFTDYDQRLAEALDDVPDATADKQSDLNADDEVTGWIALYSSKNYRVAAANFEKCYHQALEKNLLELGAFFGWCWAKALYLESLNGDQRQKEHALEIMEQAVVRGGQSSWFNRMRISLQRARRSATSEMITPFEGYSSTIIQRFDSQLEIVGTRGTRFQRWADRVQSRLESESHNEYTQGLEELGTLLGYSVTRPRHGAATDCRWRGIFGNSKELVTFEAKIEHEASGVIIPAAMGQAHNQMQRAMTEFEPYAYAVRGTIVTHLDSLDAAAEASAGSIKIIRKSAVLQLWQRVRYILTKYRDSWSLDDITARRTAATEIRPVLPTDGWFIKTLDTDQRWIDDAIILSEWPRV